MTTNVVDNFQKTANFEENFASRVGDIFLEGIQDREQVCFKDDTVTGGGGNANNITICKEYLKKYELRHNKTLKAYQWKVGEQYASTTENNLYIHLKENGLSILKGDLKAILDSDFVPIYYEPVQEKIENENASQPYISPIGMVEEYLKSEYDIRYNTVRLLTEFKHKSEKEYRDYLNRDKNTLFIALKKRGFSISQSNLDALIESSTIAKECHPFKEYFESLGEWDMQVDYFEKLATYITFIDEAEKKRFVYHLRKHFIRIIKQALDYNYFNKQCLVLVGNQNDGKSYLLRWFVPKALGTKYLKEDLKTDNKDDLIAVTQTLISNYEELRQLDDKKMSELKALFAKNSVNARHPFERKTIDCKRHTSFVGSTNFIQFLNDATGSVRFLCFILEGRIDWKGYTKEMNVDDLYKQAYHAYKNGAEYDLTEAEIEENEMINQRHIVENDAVNLILSYFRQGTPDNYHEFMTSTDISLYLEKETFRKIYTNVVGKALIQLKYAKKIKRVENCEYPKQGYYILFANKIEPPKPSQDFERAKSFILNLGVGTHIIETVKLAYNNMYFPYLTNDMILACMVEIISDSNHSKRIELSNDKTKIIIHTPF